MNRSRLSHRLEKQTMHTLLFSIVGIIALLFILFQFGVPFLANASLFLSGAQNKTEETKKVPGFIAPPVLDALPNATNSASIKVTGTGTEKQTVKLFINGRLVDTTTVKNDHSFLFTNVTLKNGENLIRTKTETKEKELSVFSNQYTVIFKKNLPTLSVDSPTDNQSFGKDDKTASVKGKTDIGVKVTVNDFWAITDNDGNFSYTLQLQSGENKIKIVATDEAGNKAEKEVIVTYSP